MTERPIIFGSPMVRAILAGRKTQTRRVVSSAALMRAASATPGHSPELLALCPYGLPADRRGAEGADLGSEGRTVQREACRSRAQDGSSIGVRDRSQGGAILWVREAHALVDAKCWSGLPCKQGPDGRWVYYREGFDRVAPRWRPSIHLPRWASRLLLEVVGVRVERLQAITEEDARAEGVVFNGTWWLGGVHPIKGTPQCWPTAREAFSRLWDEINGRRKGCAWRDNPWVWCVEFRRELEGGA